MTGQRLLAFLAKPIAGLGAAAIVLALAGCSPGTAAVRPSLQATWLAEAGPAESKRASSTEKESPPDPAFTESAGALLASLPPPQVQVSTPLPATSHADVRVVQAAASAPTAARTALCLPGQDCLEGQHLWLARPFGPEGVNYIDTSYRYGDTQGGTREPHHGVEFQNPAGTPVLAVAPGTVLAAGNDWKQQYGPTLFFYGNLVVLELGQRFLGLPVYVLYGHLSQVSVRPGQRVETGEVIGQVGGTGVALGPHLHLEVRVGRDDYGSTRNPELWLAPLTHNGEPLGALAGRILDSSGNPLTAVPVTVRSLAVDYPGPVHRYVFTYASADLNGDDLLQENFVVSELPPGTYEVSVNTTRLYRQTVTIGAGQVALAEFRVGPPPPPTPAPSPTP